MGKIKPKPILDASRGLAPNVLGGIHSSFIIKGQPGLAIGHFGT